MKFSTGKKFQRWQSIGQPTDAAHEIESTEKWNFSVLRLKHN